MRLVLVNPHTQNFGRSVSGFIFRRKDFMKYDYFIEFFVKKKKQNVAFFVDGTRTSFGGVGLSFVFSFKFIAWIEVILWMILNKINPITTRVYFDIKKLDPKNDILFDFSRSIVDVEDQDRLSLNHFKGLILIHFTHYFKDVRRLANYLKTIQHYKVVAESDLTNNVFFQKHFGFVQEVYQLPFTFGERFVNRKEFDSRLNKCLALGSITRVRNQEFLDFFSDAEGLHPMRKVIFNNSEKYSKEIDCFIRGFDNVSDVRKVQARESFIASLAKKHLPFVLLEKFYPTPQIAYFSFDIVEKFNSYKMFLCPEESVGLPSINVFEGMATENAYVGIDDPMYTALGMLPAVHYIGYKEDDVGDLLEKVRYYQENPSELRVIAKAGYRYVQNNFSREMVANTFWGDLECLSQNFSSSRNSFFKCSFKKGL